MYIPPTITGYYIKGEFYTPDETSVLNGLRVVKSSVDPAPLPALDKRKLLTVRAPIKRTKYTGVEAEYRRFVKAYIQSNRPDNVLIAKVKGEETYILIKKSNSIKVKHGVMTDSRVFVPAASIPDSIKTLVMGRKATYTRPESDNR